MMITMASYKTSIIPKLNLPKIPLPKFLKPPKFPALISAVAFSIAKAPPSLVAEIQKAALLDFDLTLPQIPKLPSLLLAAASAFSIAQARPSFAAEKQKAALFDFDFTLPVIAIEFLFLMVALDKIYYTPLGRFMDERDAAFREGLNSVEDIKAEARELNERAAAMMRAARAEIAAATIEMKKEARIEVEEKVAEGRRKVAAELEEALADLEKEKAAAVEAIDAEIAAISDQILKKVIPAAVFQNNNNKVK